MPELIDLIDRAWDTLIRRPVLVWAGVAGAVTAADVVVKTGAVAVLREGQCIPPNSRNVAVCLVRSPGVVSSPTVGGVYAAVVAAVIAAAVWWVWRRQSPTWAVALGLLAGGVAGNLVDRLFRDATPFAGRVVDVFSVGLDINLADCAIGVGVVLIVVLALVGRRIDDRLRPVADEPEQSDELDPDDEKVALAHRRKYPARKWDPVSGTPGSPDDLGESGAGSDDDPIEEDDRPTSTRPRYPANKWDRS